jgi:hypothetical protein
MAIFSISPIPSQRMNRGIKAEAGIYRTKPTTGSVKASATLKVPIIKPMGTPIMAAMINPVITRYTLLRISVVNSNSKKRSTPAWKTLPGDGRNRGSTNLP